MPKKQKDDKSLYAWALARISLGLILLWAFFDKLIGLKIATLSGALLMLMMWSAVLPGENNPVLDDHIINIILLIGLLLANDRQKWGLRNWWVKQPLVKRYPVLE